MTQMSTLLIPANAQPFQHRRPTKIVEATVKTQDRYSSRNTDEDLYEHCE
jgi:hypothetical protein